VVWWRVVRADGFLSTVHRSPLIAAEQTQKLIQEGVSVVENRVQVDKFWQED
jgi:alkylated DNA nucleotide flippase Atl1